MLEPAIVRKLERTECHRAADKKCPNLRHLWLPFRVDHFSFGAGAIVRWSVARVSVARPISFVSFRRPQGERVAGQTPLRSDLRYRRRHYKGQNILWSSTVESLNSLHFHRPHDLLCQQFDGSLRLPFRPLTIHASNTIESFACIGDADDDDDVGDVVDAVLLVVVDAAAGVQMVLMVVVVVVALVVEFVSAPAIVVCCHHQQFHRLRRLRVIEPVDHWQVRRIVVQKTLPLASVVSVR